MPDRTKATLRDLRTSELLLQHCMERGRAFTAFQTHVGLAMQNGEDTMRHQLQQAKFELDTSLAVALRMHELRMQELQTITRFPDE